MCYSAMVQQDLKQLSLTFRARIDHGAFHALFGRRANGERIAVSHALEEYFLAQTDDSPQRAAIQHLINSHRGTAAQQAREALAAQHRRLAAAERKLATKPTKTAEREREVARRRIAVLQGRIDRGHAPELRDADSRIYPMYHAPLVIWDGASAVIRPLRYHLRPQGQSPAFDKKYAGCYNARYDNLRSFVWRSVFGKRHGVLLVHRFYENVARHSLEGRALRPGEREENIVVSFSPPHGNMLVPCLFDTWSDDHGDTLSSFAIITFEPPPEVAATGHDRCPGFLKSHNVEAWLRPERQTQQQLRAILEDREQPGYTYAIAA